MGLRLALLALIVGLAASRPAVAGEGGPLSSLEKCASALSGPVDAETYLKRQGSFFFESNYRLAFEALPRGRKTLVTKADFTGPLIPNYEVEVGLSPDRKGMISNQGLATMTWGSFGRIELREALWSPEPIDKVLIAVHVQDSNWLLSHARAVLMRDGENLRVGFSKKVLRNVLESPEFANVPRIFLANKTYPIPSEKFLRHATILFNSYMGELPLVPKAREYHLVGEQLSGCVSQAALSILRRTEYSPPGFIPRLVLHADELLDGHQDEFTGANWKLWAVGPKVEEAGAKEFLNLFAVRVTAAAYTPYVIREGFAAGRFKTDVREPATLEDFNAKSNCARFYWRLLDRRFEVCVNSRAVGPN